MATPASREFDPARITPGETIVAGSGIGLFVFLFFHWFGGASAWKVFDVVDLLLAVIAVLAVAVAGTKAMGNRLFGDNAGMIVLLLGTVASSITLTFVLEGNNREIGLWLSFFSSLGIVYGAWRMMNEAPDTPGPLANVNIPGTGSSPPPTEPTTPMAAPSTSEPASGDGDPPSAPPQPAPAAEPPGGEGTRPAGV